MAYIARYTFSSPEGNSHFQLEYDIYENDLTSRWAQALQLDLDRKKNFKQGLFYGSRFVDEAKLRRELQSDIDKVNSYKNTTWIHGKTYPNMTHEDLMKLHEEFENLIPTDDFTSKDLPKDILHYLLSVNTRIHQYENIYGDPNKFHIDIQFENLLSWELNNNDLKRFTADLEDGDLFLDYGVTGVPVLNAYFENVKQKPVPQYMIKSGVKLYFSGTSKFHFYAEKLDKWLKDRWDWDIKDPKLAIGFIPLGKLKTKLNKDEIGRQLEHHSTIHSVELLDSETLEKIYIPWNRSQLKRYFYNDVRDAKEFFDSLEAN